MNVDELLEIERNSHARDQKRLISKILSAQGMGLDILYVFPFGEVFVDPANKDPSSTRKTYYDAIDSEGNQWLITKILAPVPTWKLNELVAGRLDEISKHLKKGI